MSVPMIRNEVPGPLRTLRATAVTVLAWLLGTGVAAVAGAAASVAAGPDCDASGWAAVGAGSVVASGVRAGAAGVDVGVAAGLGSAAA